MGKRKSKISNANMSIILGFNHKDEVVRDKLTFNTHIAIIFFPFKKNKSERYSPSL